MLLLLVVWVICNVFCALASHILGSTLHSWAGVGPFEHERDNDLQNEIERETSAFSGRLRCVQTPRTDEFGFSVDKVLFSQNDFHERARQRWRWAQVGFASVADK